MKINIKISGDMFKNLDKLQDGINDGVKEITKVIFNDVYNRAPIETYNLKKTMHAELIPKGKSIVGKILTKAWYWFYVEYGAAPHDVKMGVKKLLADGVKVFGKIAKNVRTPKRSFVRASINKNKKWANQIMMTCIKRSTKLNG